MLRKITFPTTSLSARSPKGFGTPRNFPITSTPYNLANDGRSKHRSVSTNLSSFETHVSFRVSGRWIVQYRTGSDEYTHPRRDDRIFAAPLGAVNLGYSVMRQSINSRRLRTFRCSAMFSYVTFEYFTVQQRVTCTCLRVFRY